MPAPARPPGRRVEDPGPTSRQWRSTPPGAIRQLRYYVPRRSIEPVNDPSLLILTSLSSGPKHGHALLLDIDSFAGLRLGPGTLYGAITRLEERGLIEPLEADDRRRPYRITAAGTTALSDSLSGLRRLVEVGDDEAGGGDMRLLLLAYPRRWRERYGDEFLALLEAAAADLACAHQRSAFRSRRASARLQVHRRCACSGRGRCSSSGAWHSRRPPSTGRWSCPAGARGVPTAAFDIVQAAAVVGSIAVLAAVAIAIPGIRTRSR